ncbi:hypothetical protein RGQ15_16890 [Paracoccus sp. MBLB3053]|uniref:RcnB family protein n=1 Tax=Paracoccus aurantius TaxID=3073814 RepID=A0ABU2HW20_9RHOB|nr:hypothetical protein [Paracoccus sp. MBLB3053]MDS9469240.1 hypothetical protein [Paracoccus sp. MBLB3053]
MRKFLISAALGLANLACTPALAAPAEQSPCQHDKPNCVQPLAAGEKTEQKKAPQAQAANKGAKSVTTQQQHAAPRTGGSARNGRTLRSDELRRLAGPGAGRDYRVVEDRVVLVDASSLKIVHVLGLASELLK